MYHRHDRCVHLRRPKLAIGPNIELLERLPQLLRLPHIDGDKLQNPVLRDDAHDHGTMRLVVDIDEWDSAGPGLGHLAAGLVERPLGVDGDGFNGRDADCFFDIWGGLGGG
jgi:hypothetical protein